ncbi:MAG: hypothetical protein HQK81_01145 [Desulfovibrionaceae bacterium]|nr:hypothetical protein [Desulfovibrionaceae bacterium]MBF0512654.1 hypothetical protein [Desulfovibrionaceae bacterium]
MAPFELFLHDAGVLPEPGQGPSDVRRRCAELVAPLRAGCQITLNHRFFLSNGDAVIEELAVLARSFETVLIHPHSTYELPFGCNAYTEGALALLARAHKACPNIAGYCFHPDLVTDFAPLAALASETCYVAVEGMGKISRRGKTFAEIEALLAAHDFLGFVPDTAHVQEMLSAGEPGLAAYLDAFAARIIEIHLSQTGNFYDPRAMPEGFETNHSLVQFDTELTRGWLSSLGRLDSVNIVLEGVIPTGRLGAGLLAAEVDFVRSVMGDFTPAPAASSVAP